MRSRPSIEVSPPSSAVACRASTWPAGEYCSGLRDEVVDHHAVAGAAHPQAHRIAPQHVDRLVAHAERARAVGRQVAAGIGRIDPLDEQVLAVEVGGGEAPADRCRCGPARRRASRARWRRGCRSPARPAARGTRCRGSRAPRCGSLASSGLPETECAPDSTHSFEASRLRVATLSVCAIEAGRDRGRSAPRWRASASASRLSPGDRIRNFVAVLADLAWRAAGAAARRASCRRG